MSRGGDAGTEAAEKLMAYIEECYCEPPSTWCSGLFEEMTYSRWAALEIVELLMDRPLDPPEDVVSDFLLRVALYSQVAKTPIQQRVFSIAEDTAEDILQFFSQS